MYLVEQQAVSQLTSAPNLVGDSRLAADLRCHHTETEEHIRLVRERLDNHGAMVSALKVGIMKMGGKGFILLAIAQPETSGKLIVHSFSYEAMEWAGYELLRRFAEAAGDFRTVEAACGIRDQEAAMMERLEKDFDAAEEASHRNMPPQKLDAHLRRHFKEAHALEIQSVNLLRKAKDTVKDQLFSEVCNLHLEQARDHSQLLEQRLRLLGSKNSKFDDSILAFGGQNWNLFFRPQSANPAKLAVFVYAHEHLKTASYELLKRNARRAKRTEMESFLAGLAKEQREMAERVSDAFDSVVEATFHMVHR